MSDKYHVISFDDERSVSVTPDLWVQNNECLWPPYKGLFRMQKAMEHREVPGDEWTSYPCRVLYTGSFSEAQKRLRRAEETSDLQSSADELPAKRKKVTPRRLMDDSSSEDDELENNQLLTTPPVCTPSSNRTPLALPQPPAPLQMSPPATLQTSPPAPLQTSTPVRNQGDSSKSHANMRVQGVGTAAVTKILTLLEVVREEQKEHKKMLTQLLSRAPYEEEQPADLSLSESGIHFPVCTLEEMAALDHILKEAKHATAVVRFLSTFGGIDLRETVDRILREALTNNLAKGYNMKGQKGKEKFETLSLLTVLFRCVQRNPSTRHATRRDVEAEVTKWLSGSRDRQGGRKERANKQQVNPQRDTDDNDII